MQHQFKNIIAGAVMLAAAGFSHSALAADLAPPMPEAPAIPEVVPPAVGGWYLRGDIGYSWSKFRETTYDVPNNGCGTCGAFVEKSLDGDLKGSFLAGGGIGYQVTDYFRTDLTADYMFRSKFEGGSCSPAGCSDDRSKLSALSILANAYVDLGNFNGFTPYVGAGIGGTRVKWDDLVDHKNGTTQEGAANWRFTYALMAGVAFDLTQNLKLDAGYRYRHVNGGKMFDGGQWIGDGHDDGLNIHDVRVGLRYQFGAPSAGYAPEPLPIYK
ncbi:outer membrane protein [Brucella sp. IR073]|uniref:outer membrane protein n=1 Tax=unclassified Brucella TaxID=2632610 RepID=UPI003B97D111